MPMDRRLYPDDWDSIASRVKNAVEWHCQACGRACRLPGETFDTHKRTLTVAHINHCPEDCRDENLVALCAPCHLRYDSEMRRMRRLAKKRVTLTPAEE